MTHCIYHNILCHWFSVEVCYFSWMDHSESLLFLSHDSFIGCECINFRDSLAEYAISLFGLIMEILNICPDWFSLPGMFLVTFGSLVRCDITSSMILYVPSVVQELWITMEGCFSAWLVLFSSLILVLFVHMVLTRFGSLTFVDIMPSLIRF